jgi:hypothetical protein
MTWLRTFLPITCHKGPDEELRCSSTLALISALDGGRSRDSVVGIANRYRLEGPGIESRWGEIFRTYPDRLRGPPSLLYNGYRVFPGNKGGRGVMLTTHSLLVPRLRKSWAIPALTLWALWGLLRGSLYLLLDGGGGGQRHAKTALPTPPPPHPHPVRAPVFIIGGWVVWRKNPFIPFEINRPKTAQRVK